MHQHRKIQKRKKRVLPVPYLESCTACQMEFFVTLVIGWKFTVKYSLFRTYILSKTGMTKPSENLVIIVNSLRTRYSIKKKTMCENSHDMTPIPLCCSYAFAFDDPLLTLNANVMTGCSHIYFYIFWLVILSQHRDRVIITSTKKNRDKNLKNFLELSKYCTNYFTKVTGEKQV